MDSIRIFSADNEQDLWQQVQADIDRQPDAWEYAAELEHAGCRIRFNREIDLGGGFESGMELTSFTASVPQPPAFRFTLHEQDWVHEIGKVLGLTDVELGDDEIDEAYIITTNDTPALHALLADATLRQTLLRYQEMRLDLAPATTDNGAEVLLTLTKEEAITDPAQLREIYHLFYTVLRQVMALAPPAPGATPPQA